MSAQPNEPEPIPCVEAYACPPLQSQVLTLGGQEYVVLPREQFERLLEDLDDLAAICESYAEGGETIPWEQVKAELDGA